MEENLTAIAHLCGGPCHGERVALPVGLEPPPACVDRDLIQGKVRYRCVARDGDQLLLAIEDAAALAGERWEVCVQVSGRVRPEILPHILKQEAIKVLRGAFPSLPTGWDWAPIQWYRAPEGGSGFIVIWAPRFEFSNALLRIDGRMNGASPGHGPASALSHEQGRQLGIAGPGL